MRVLLFTGKGGVGKTTLAAATAAATVAAGRKALVVSTDPAHSLADAFGAELGPRPSELDTGLYGAQIDTRRLVDGAWEDMRGHLRTLLAGAGIDELAAEELTALPGVEELLALAEVHRLATTGPWDAVIVDCGPTAETLRLLALPEAVGNYLERLFPTHRRVVRGLLAGVAGSAAPARWDAAADAIGRLAEHLEAVRSLLVDQERTSVRLVLTPERVVAAETRRTLTALALQGIRVDGLVANRLLPDAAAGRGAAASWLRTRRAEQDTVLAELRAAEVPVQTVGYRACEPVGVPALLELAQELYPEGDPLAVSTTTAEPLLSVTASNVGYQLRVSFPLDVDADLDLARVDDELAITVDGRRRLVALPAALRRCEVTGAEIVDGGLLVDFEPDPRLWMR
ncbi:ArsA family ATPase [Kutzneria sp. CA-103260]|uniref:ArsA family ATPase n=1 Tax=Kutzneria sp. CA-103260 TaxID=2802641 RepID=UPI001BABAC91|nr:ArsA family ATPase [Kutzneria sp. CA-103260]QUQ67760.1 arsenite-transporting ATPase [Kutzneria sp. CA-103260]